MNREKIGEMLNTLFKRPLSPGARRHIVFWYDKEKTYLETVSELAPESVKVHILWENNNFATKKLLEFDDTDSHYLIYAPMGKPEQRSNWFLDTLLYSQEFTPDLILIIANDLGITDDSAKRLLKKYKAFFQNKDRYKKIKSISSAFTEETLELSIMAVLCKDKSPSIEDIVQRILAEGLEKDNPHFQEIKKLGMEERFWDYVKSQYGYTSSKKTLKHLFDSIMMTALEDKLGDDFPIKWKSYVIKKPGNCVLFIDHWMKDTSLKDSYDNLSLRFEESYDIPSSIKDWNTVRVKFLDCDILKVFDREIIHYILENLQSKAKDYERLKWIIKARKTSHWFKEFENIYEALDAATDLFSFMAKYDKYFSQTTAVEFITAYANEYYKADQAYRRFCTAYDKIGNIDMHDLGDRVENLYGNSYVKELAASWSELVSNEMSSKWFIRNVGQQWRFYQNHVEEISKKDERGKAYVIISDGLRYEVGQELSTFIKSDEKIKADVEISFMQGVIPSYTKLGMASLLPHSEIGITSDGAITVDGLGTSDISQREKILRKYCEESKALTYQDLKKMSRNELREYLKDSRVVYIYHNYIDAMGDKASTEHEAFAAVAEAIKQIMDCIRRLVNYVSATNIFITSDHGFVFQRKPLEESEKLIKEISDTIEAKKRFILAREAPDKSIPGTHTISLDYILGKNCPIQLITPKGIHRFKISGAGANYVHGGISLQEIVIPLIKFKAHKVTKQKKVEVLLTNTSRKITNNKFTLNFFQKEKISDNVLPRVLKVYLYDVTEDRKISDEKIIVADKESDSPQEREIKTVITLRNTAHDKDKEYFLKMEEDGDVYSELIAFKVNIAFTDNFGF